ncbi:MAG: hypothetical protein IJB51_06270 [Clostridia bacterium]|nr:hypothetical protein [Clostridia bacterium]
MGTFKIFYSWQSDLPANKTRNFIRECIDEAIDLAEESEAIEAERDEATKGTTGSPNIVTTLFSKIDNCDFFVADVSLCYTCDTKGEKKSPNPNVLLELGYAVKTLGWERVICLCNTDFGDTYPFDIAHNRITGYSLDGKKEKEVRNYIRKIIFSNIRDLKNANPRAKAGEASHILGNYDYENRIVKENLIPINITQREGYILHNMELLEEARKLFTEIQELNQQVNPTHDSYKSITSTPAETIGVTIKSDALDALTKIFAAKETPAVWRDTQEDTKLIKDWLGVDIIEDFFFLGNLKYVTQGYNPFDTSPTLSGSDAEIKKHSKLRQLSRCLTRLEVRTTYLKTFDGMLFIPVAIQNISALQDENIRVVLNVEGGEIVEPTEKLIWSEYEGIQGMLCREDDDGDDVDVGIICELFGLKEDGFIHTEDIPYDPARYTHRTPIMTPNGFGYPAKSEKDYALELQEFIASANGLDYYEFDVSNLRPGECKWLCCGMLIKPAGESVRITYHIHSTHSTGELSGTFEISAVYRIAVV